MRLILALALTVGASTPLPAAESTPKNPTTLDVVVEDSRGRAIDSLAPSDFSVTEQSRPLALDSVRFVRASTTAVGVAAVPVNAAAQASHADSGRLVAIYLDEFHVVPGPAADRVRLALIRLISEDVEASDRLIVLKSLDSLLDIKPTTDRRDAIQKLESFDPRRGDYQPRTSFERNFIAGTPARVETARAQIATSSLEALATELGRLSASRKTLIVVSEGFTRGTRRRGDDLLPSLESVVLAANRAQVSIYPFDPSTENRAAVASDGATDDVSKWRDALRSLADGTSGRAISAAGDVESGLKRALADSRGYYELTLSKDLAHDGRFHAVDVSVKRPGLTVHARKGYWAPSDAEPSWRAALAAATAIPFGATLARRTSPLIRPWFGISKTSDGQTEIDFVWEPAPRVPGDRNPPPPLAQVGLSVMTMDGSSVYQGIVLPSTAAAVGDPDSSRQSRASFVSPAGRLVVQMSIEDVTSRVVDHDVRDLEVKGFPGPVSMGSPQVLRARNAREYQALAADPEATPVAARQFSRAERLLVRIPVFSAGSTPTVSARLVTSFGSAMRDLVVTSTPSRPNEYQADVPLAALANGSYIVEWTARTADGEVRDRVPFRVTP
jgi:VWFA-related protein